MKKRLVLSVFACILALFALTTCENQQVIHILSAPSELSFLGVIAYAGEYAIPGGASVEPAFMASVFDYTAYVDKDATHFVIDAEIDGEGTLTVHSDQVTGDTTTRFDLLGDEAVVTVKATRQYMETTEYRVTVTRGEPVPTAKDVEISVHPEIGAFFIGAGVIPTIKVTAVPPGTGVAFNYQWYVNDQNNTRTGNPITGANEDSYTMQAIETMTERTVYYYVDITTVFEGKTGITQSAPEAVTFLNKNDLDPRSRTMVDIPPGNVTASQWRPGYDWSTPGFRMGQCPVTWELWKTVFDHASAGNYNFARKGNQGAALADIQNGSTNNFPRPVGNALHPVTVISWREVVVWCNAYSEMEGLEPVYRDTDGQPLRDNRDMIELLIDFDAMAGYNGYRLPTFDEWEYAARGANPLGDHWNEKWPGTDSDDWSVVAKYLWSYSPDNSPGGLRQTGEVGKLLPNQLWNGISYVDGLFDMLGMVWHWIENPYNLLINNSTNFYGGDFVNSPSFQLGVSGQSYTSPSDTNFYSDTFIGFRVVRNRD